MSLKAASPVSPGVSKRSCSTKQCRQTHSNLLGGSGVQTLSRKALHNCTNYLLNICLSPAIAGPEESSCIAED